MEPHPIRRVMAAPALLGRNSLAVFSFHLPLVMIAINVIQIYALSNTAQILVAILVIAQLFPWSAWLDRRKFRAGTPWKSVSGTSLKLS